MKFALVATLEEHALLESMIEAAKPPLDNTLKAEWNYLLFSPFRYPPLRYGSRFGGKHEPSLWYGSQQLPGALDEVAYYRLVFLHDSEADLDYIAVTLTAFEVELSADRSIDLTITPFDAHHATISSPEDYHASQALGTAMRQAGVQAFRYFSARCPAKSINVGVFTPRVFKPKHPKTPFQNWECLANRDGVEFRRQTQNGTELQAFPLSTFTVSGTLPLPA